ncbi:hypothetical protein RI129_009538 [Pyrocoelia pectoralis]|uniref:Cyclic nucleotide-binding domain-containing protein n=1 Tax=Pyrocoelia pectoralis TaxID=417401 RepID=A0AAN7V8N2_9COLE
MEQEKRAVTVVAIECCELYALSRKNFQKAMGPYQELKESMKKMAERQLQSAILTL